MHKKPHKCNRYAPRFHDETDSTDPHVLTNKQRIFQNTKIDHIITVKLNTTLGRTKPFEG